MNKNAIDAASFPQRLKEITSQSHQNLENLPLSRSITDPAVTKQQYIHYLSLMHDVVKDAEENIFPALEGIIEGVASRNKSYLIENDFTALGYLKSNSNYPLSSSLNIVPPAFALGIMYVIEGSTLGGRFILKNINEALGYTPEEGAQYFNGYGNTTGSKWKSFINQMEQYTEESNNEDKIIEGAHYAFNAINRHFTENTPL